MVSYTGFTCFIRAVDGCDYVIHAASPFPLAQPKNEDELIRPAREGTLNVLRAASQSGTVKRVVLTSSCVAIMAGQPGGKQPMTEDSWGLTDSANVTAYEKSKTLAERAAWDFMKELPGQF